MNQANKNPNRICFIDMVRIFCLKVILFFKLLFLKFFIFSSKDFIAAFCYFDLMGHDDNTAILFMGDFLESLTISCDAVSSRFPVGSSATIS